MVMLNIPAATYPYAKPVTHHDLVKFGEDKTQRAKKPSFPSKTMFAFGSSNVSTVIELAIPIIEVIQIVHKTDNQIHEVFVDRHTGRMRNCVSYYSFIERFDPQSFPEQPLAQLSDVRYWVNDGA